MGFLYLSLNVCLGVSMAKGGEQSFTREALSNVKAQGSPEGKPVWRSPRLGSSFCFVLHFIFPLPPFLFFYFCPSVSPSYQCGLWTAHGSVISFCPDSRSDGSCGRRTKGGIMRRTTRRQKEVLTPGHVTQRLHVSFMCVSSCFLLRVLQSL